MWLSSISHRQSFKVENIIPPEMKECLNKHYTLCQNEKFDKFLHELGVSKMEAAKASALKPTVIFRREGTEYILTTTYTDARSQIIRFHIGEKVKKHSLAGLSATSVFKIRGTTLTETEQLGRKTVQIVREFGRSFLKVIMKVNKMKCSRLYSYTESKHSIQTETSRRESLMQTATIPEDASEYELVSSAQSTFQDLDSEDNICY